VIAPRSEEFKEENGPGDKGHMAPASAASVLVVATAHICNTNSDYKRAHSLSLRRPLLLYQRLLEYSFCTKV
jgi:hypothetical protein